MLQGNDSTDLNIKLHQLIASACSMPKQSFQRRQYLHQFMQLLLGSGRLWVKNTPDYEDALQEVMLRVCKKPEQYDPAKSSVLTWVNNLLKFKLLELNTARYKEIHREIPKIVIQGRIVDPVDQVPAPPPVPPILEETKQWIMADSGGELRRLCLRDRTDVNCQVLLLRRFPPETSWDDIAAELGVPKASAAMHYQRKCLPCLLRFGYRQGYLDDRA